MRQRWTSELYRGAPDVVALVPVRYGMSALSMTWLIEKSWSWR